MNIHVTPNIPGQPSGDRIVSMMEAAVIAGVSIDTLKRLNARGEIQIVRLSKRRIGIQLSRLIKFIADRAA